MAGLGDDPNEVPAALLAVTLKVYLVLSARPETVASPGPVVVALCPPGDAVTVYLVIAEPPLLAGAVQDTVASALPA